MTTALYIISNQKEKYFCSANIPTITQRSLSSALKLKFFLRHRWHIRTVIITIADGNIRGLIFAFSRLLMAIESARYEGAMIEVKKLWEALRFVGRVILLSMAFSTKCRTCLPFYWHSSVTKWLKNGTIPQHFTRSGIKSLHKNKDRIRSIS